MSSEDILTLTDDILTNFDYYHNNFKESNPNPEKDLMISVLIYSVIDYLSNNKKSFYKSARDWFYEKDEQDYIYSFTNICFILGFNPMNFRKKLVKLKRKKFKFALDGKRIINC